MLTREQVPDWLRIAGQDMPASQVLGLASPWLAERGIETPSSSVSQPDDYTQVDLLLEVARGATTVPPSGAGYAGFTATQRGAFLDWARTPEQEVPAPFRQLYCAALEVHLLERCFSENPTRIKTLLEHLERLAHSAAWQHDLHLGHLLMLASRLTGKGALCCNVAIAPSALGVALGIQASVTHPAPLNPAQVLRLAREWRIHATPPDESLLALRLAEDALTHGDLLQRAVKQVEVGPPRPFRLAHRDLRLAFPQPDLRPLLEPMLTALLESVLDSSAEDDIETESVEEGDSGKDNLTETSNLPTISDNRGRKSKPLDEKAKPWQLVLEFAESRSQYAHFALEIAQQMPGYTTLLDEDRTIIHRILYKKSELRRFWRLWDYVQGWNSVHVYLNGEELEKWQVWPWSQYLR